MRSRPPGRHRKRIKFGSCIDRLIPRTLDLLLAAALSHQITKRLDVEPAARWIDALEPPLPRRLRHGMPTRQPPPPTPVVGKAPVGKPPIPIVGKLPIVRKAAIVGKVPIGKAPAW
jgi:hypothetical protein